MQSLHIWIQKMWRYWHQQVSSPNSQTGGWVFRQTRNARTEPQELEQWRKENFKIVGQPLSEHFRQYNPIAESYSDSCLGGRCWYRDPLIFSECGLTPYAEVCDSTFLSCGNGFVRFFVSFWPLSSKNSLLTWGNFVWRWHHHALYW